MAKLHNPRFTHKLLHQNESPTFWCVILLGFGVLLASAKKKIIKKNGTSAPSHILRVAKLAYEPRTTGVITDMSIRTKKVVNKTGLCIHNNLL